MAQNDPSRRTIPVSQLLLDTQNPRLPKIQDSQRGAIQAMLTAQGNKLVALAQHLAKHGPDPASSPIVMRSSQDKEMYCVLDGNRRVTALKLLETPTLAEGMLDRTALQDLKHAADKLRTNPIVELECVVVYDRDGADTWIQLTHRGQNQGAGLVEWDGQVAARYDARKGNKIVALQALDFVREHGVLSEKTRQRIDSGKFPITNLSRLLNTPYVRKRLGIDRQNGTIVARFPDEEVLKGLTRMVEDIGSKRITVSKIKSQEQRVDYINRFDEVDLPEAERMLDEVRPLGTPPSEGGSGASLSTKKKRRKRAHSRTTLIPRSCNLQINQPRIDRVFMELRRLSVEEFPNAAAVMFRVFVELSLDQYLDQDPGWNEQRIRNSRLAGKLRAVADHFKTNSIMTASQLAPIYKAASGQTLLAASVKALHGYVHNRFFSAIASEIKTAWDDFQPFVEKLWAL